MTSENRPRLIIDFGRVLYLGVWNDTAEHTPMVPIFGAGLDRDIQLTVDGARLVGRTAHLPAEVPRAVEALGGRLAVMPYDPVHDSVGEIDEPAALEALTQLSDAGYDATTWERLADAVGFQPLDEITIAVRDAATLLDTHHDENLPGNAIAAKVGYSLSHLQDMFRNQLGVSMRSYRTWSRLRRTATYIAPAQTITDAAIEAGFYDAAHFTRTFVATFGVLPRNVFAGDLDVYVVDG